LIDTIQNWSVPGLGEGEYGQVIFSMVPKRHLGSLETKGHAMLLRARPLSRHRSKLCWQDLVDKKNVHILKGAMLFPPSSPCEFFGYPMTPRGRLVSATSRVRCAPV
jgi:hypothetical protein